MSSAVISSLLLYFGVFSCVPRDTEAAAATQYGIATFNIQNLGPAKVNNPATLQILRQILTRYDVIAVQEVQDKIGTAITILRQTLNEGTTPSKRYKYVLSDRVGDTRGEEEQYAIFYRPSVVSVSKTKQYADTKNHYSRVPLLTRVNFKNAGVPEFVLVTLHARPDDTSKKLTVQEIAHLADVYDYIQTEIGVSDVLFAGDLNADGKYVSKRDWKNVAFRNDPRFQWLISDDSDTTVGNSDMAYDRIIVAGKALQSAIVPNSAAVYRFDEELSIDKAEALKVSDHYPVEVKLQSDTKKRRRG